MPIQDVALKTHQKQWMIEKDGEKGSGMSLLMARHDDDDDGSTMIDDHLEVCLKLVTSSYCLDYTILVDSEQFIIVRW